MRYFVLVFIVFFICLLLKLECFGLAKIYSLHLEQSVVRFGILPISWESYLESFVPHVVELVTEILAVPEIVDLVFILDIRESFRCPWTR